MLIEMTKRYPLSNGIIIESIRLGGSCTKVTKCEGLVREQATDFQHVSYVSGRARTHAVSLLDSCADGGYREPGSNKSGHVEDFCFDGQLTPSNRQ